MYQICTLKLKLIHRISLDFIFINIMFKVGLQAYFGSWIIGYV